MFKRLVSIFLFPLLVFAQAPKVTVTTRVTAGGPLTFTQADKNFTDLQAAANASQRAWGQKESTTTGLTFGYYGGPAFNGTTWTAISDGTVSLMASATNYVERTSAGVVSKNTTGWSSGKIPLATVVTSGSAITTVQDFRGGPVADGIAYTAPLTGGIVRTQADKNLDVLTASDFQNDMAGLQAALTAAAGRSITIRGTFTITGQITIPSGITIIGEAGATIQTATADITMFDCTNVSSVTIRGIKFKSTAAGTAAYKAAVKLTTSTDCIIENCVFEGMSWAGVWINGSSRCHIIGSYFSGWLGTVQDAADICIQNASLDNVVSNNRLYGGGEHGCLIQDPYSTGPLVPLRNSVISNKIGQHTGYGVAVYIPAQTSVFTGSISGTVLTVSSMTSGSLAVGQLIANGSTGALYGIITSLGTGTGGTGTYNLDTSNTIGSISMATSLPMESGNQIVGNTIKDIQGSFATNRSSGAGIYVVGSGASGTQIVDNVISNCCVQTLNNQLAPAGIGLNGIARSASSVVVSGNTIFGMTKYHGVIVTSSPGGAVVSGNSITVPSGNTTGSAIRVDGNSGNTIIQGNRINALNNQSSVIVYATGSVPIDGVTVDGNSIYHTSGIGLQMLDSTGGGVTDVIITNNRLKTTLNTQVGFNISALTNCLVSGNIITNGTQLAATFALCTNLRLANNIFKSAGTTSVAFAASNVSGYFDKTNSYAGLVNNSSAGAVRIETFGTAAPATGTWTVGDRVEQATPVVGNPKGWRCTVAGAPGTWVSEGNL